MDLNGCTVYGEANQPSLHTMFENWTEPGISTFIYVQVFPQGRSEWSSNHTNAADVYFAAGQLTMSADYRTLRPEMDSWHGNAHLHIFRSSGCSRHWPKGQRQVPSFQDWQILGELANILEPEDWTSEDRLVWSSVAQVWKLYMSRFIQDQSTKPDAAASVQNAMS